MQVVINGRKGHTIIVKYVVKRLSNAKGDNMKRNNKWLDLVLYILSAEVIGMSSGLLAGSFNEFFQKYNKPPLMPPSWFVAIYREVRRGRTTQRNSDWTERTIYSADLAQMKYEVNKKQCGRELKIGNDYKFLNYIEKKIADDILGSADSEFPMEHNIRAL